jgi:hypothetical protein
MFRRNFHSSLALNSGEKVGIFCVGNNLTYEHLHFAIREEREWEGKRDRKGGKGRERRR